MWREQHYFSTQQNISQSLIETQCLRTASYYKVLAHTLKKMYIIESPAID